MLDLQFQIEGAKVVPHSISPLLALQLRITSTRPIASLALNCQVQIEVRQRRYSTSEQPKLFELFGEPSRWSRTLNNLLWTQTRLDVPTFSDSTRVDLPVPCTFDFNVAATKYLHALGQGEVPLCLLFSGTVFYHANDGALQIAQVPWDKEATFRLPVQVWKDMMDQYYPNSAWLCLERAAFDRLHQYKVAQGLATWDQALESLLSPATVRVNA
jgi:hypothetical protein